MATTTCDLPPRVDDIGQRMRDNGIDATITFKPENSFNYCGLNTIIYSHSVIVILVPGREPLTLVYALRLELAKLKTFVPEIRLFGKWSGRKPVADTWQGALNIILQDLSLPGNVIGVERDFVSANRLEEIKFALPWASLVDVSPMISSSREIKDPDQIANARLAAKMADLGMAKLIEALRTPGTSERRACILAHHEMNLLWDEDEAYADVEVCGFGSDEGGMHNGIAPWMLSGPRKFLNCGNPTKRVPQPGETISAFVWAPVNGIWCEVERTICMGKIPEREQKALTAVHQIRHEVVKLYRPGVRVSEIYLAAVRAYMARGYGDNLPGRIGHGVGTGPHEPFSINATSTAVLVEGMIVTLEPHIQVIDPEGVGAVATQFSDTILITKDGHEFLTTPSKPEDLIIDC